MQKSTFSKLYFLFSISLLFFIQKIDAQDVGATALVIPASPMCPDTNQTVTVTIQNFDVASIDFSVDSVVVVVAVSGASSQNFNIVLTTGTLISGGKQNVIVTTIADLSANGVYVFEAYTTLAGDVDISNDSITPVSVNVNDVAGPVATIGTLPDLTAECSLTVSTIPTATDDCTGIIMGTTEDTLFYDEQGIHMITWTYDDGNGNTSTQTQNIIIDDISSPVEDVAVLPEITAECSVTLASPTSTDNCAGVITGATTDPLTYDVEGTYTVTWIYDDENGNITTQTQDVIIDDITAPHKDSITLSDVTGVCSVTVQNSPTATDSCVGTITGNTTDPLTYNSEGTYTITWTYDDGNGNTSTQQQNVIVTSVDTSVTVNVVTLTANNVSAGVTYQWISCYPTDDIPGETAQSFSPTSDGYYAVVVTENGCSDTSSCYLIVVTGINEAAISDSVAIYPNPTSGIVTIDMPVALKSRIFIRNIIGQMIMYQETSSQQIKIDLSDHAAGIFFITLETDSFTRLLKIAKR
ncbi:MAG: HYR-like domain-containing protein [Bacteroidota bacterium]